MSGAWSSSTPAPLMPSSHRAPIGAAAPTTRRRAFRSRPSPNPRTRRPPPVLRDNGLFMTHTRRTFLANTSLATAASVLARIPRRQLWRMAPADVFPSPDEAEMRALALAAIDAARSAGASYADVRLVVARGTSFNAAYSKDQGGEITTSWPS